MSGSTTIQHQLFRQKNLSEISLRLKFDHGFLNTGSSKIKFTETVFPFALFTAYYSY